MRYGGDGDPFSKRTKNKIFDRQDGKCHDQLGCGKPLGDDTCLLYTSPSPRARGWSRMPSSA